MSNEKFYDQMYEHYVHTYDKDNKTSFSTKKQYCTEKALDILDFLLAQHRAIQAEMREVGKYEYMVTFTLKDPSKLGDAIKFVTDTIEKRRQALGIVSFKYVVEHPDSNAHLHAYLKTKIPLRKNRFNVYEKRYGFIKIDPVKKGQSLEVENYMAKEGDIISII